MGTQAPSLRSEGCGVTGVHATAASVHVAGAGMLVPMGSQDPASSTILVTLTNGVVEAAFAHTPELSCWLAMGAVQSDIVS